MKKILMILCLVFAFSSYAYAFEGKSIGLDNIDFDRNISVKTPNQYYADDNVELNTSHTYSKRVKDSVYGAKLDSTMNVDGSKQDITLFKRFERDKFSLDTSYKRASPLTFGNQTTGMVSITPEYRLNKNLSVKNIFSSDLQKSEKKNEVVLSIQPANSDRMNFDVGAARMLDPQYGFNRSQLNFSTKFRF